MKKLLIALIVITASASVYALPIGNPWEPALLCDGIFCKKECPCDYAGCANVCDPCWWSDWGIKVGFYGDFVFNRHLEVDSGDNDSQISTTEIYTQAGYLALNLFKKYDLFCTLGATDISLRSPGKAFGEAAPNDYAYLSTDTHFSWSVGLRARLWQCGCFGIGAEAQYFQTCPNIEYTREEGSSVRYPSADVKYQEWQIGLGIAYRINIIGNATAFVPYAGIKWAGARLSTDNLVVAVDGQTFFDMENERDWGYAVGVTLVGCNKIDVTAEARFYDELAFYVNSQFRF